MGLLKNWFRQTQTSPRSRRERMDTGSVNSQELAKQLHQYCQPDLKSDAAAKRVIDALHLIMARHLDRGRQIRDWDWGTYRTKRLKARNVRTPQGRIVHVPERHYPEWRPSKRLKDAISRPGIDT